MMGARKKTRPELIPAAWTVLVAGCLCASPSLAQPAVGAPPAAAGEEQEGANPLDNAEAERLAVWNSPEMLAARAWLDDFLSSSRRYTPAEAEAYQKRLEQLDADGMRLWLAQLEQRMMRVSEQRIGSAGSRQYRLARASAVQQQRAINLARLEASQAGRARLAQSRVDEQRRFGQSAFLSRAASREETLRRQIATQNLRTFQILSLLDRQELRRDLRARSR